MFDTRLRQFRFTKSQLSNAPLAADSARISGAKTRTAKGNLEDKNVTATTIEDEAEIYEQRSREAKSQLLRFVDSAATVEENLDCARRVLERLTKSLAEQDTMINDIQRQRDEIANSCKFVQADNALLEADMQAKRQHTTTLKHEIQRLSQEDIALHFQSQSIERQMTTLVSATDSTQRLLDDANLNIRWYKTEEIALKVTYDDAMKDIARMKVDFSRVADVTQLIDRQLSVKKKEREDNTEELETIQHTLRHHVADFERQTDGIHSLQDEFERGLFRHRWLKQRAAARHSMQLEIALLESRINQERVVRSRYEMQLQRTLNVHRWTLLKSSNPDHYQAIQLVQTLKTQLEGTFRSKQRLEDTKVALLNRLARKNERIRNVRVVDGNYALSLARDSAKNKDRELRTMEGQVKSGRSRVFELESIVGNMKAMIKQSHSLTTSVRRKKQKDGDIPALPIGAKADERTRLGGGFMLVQSARAHNPKIRDSENDEFAGQPGPKKAQKGVPASARAESTVSWRPNLNPELSVTSVSSLGRDGDPVRRKPRVEAMRSKQVTREASSQSSAPRSARSSGSKHSDAPRPQIKLHAAILQF
jgi:hypothetical protein